MWTIVAGVFGNPASGHCLDSDGGDVYTMPCNGGVWQSWRTTSGSPKSISHAFTGKDLHADGNVGNQVVLKPTIGTASRWVVDRVN